MENLFVHIVNQEKIDWSWYVNYEENLVEDLKYLETAMHTGKVDAPEVVKWFIDNADISYVDEDLFDPNSRPKFGFYAERVNQTVYIANAHACRFLIEILVLSSVHLEESELGLLYKAYKQLLE